MPKLTVRSKGTEPGEVERTGSIPHMLIATIRSMLAEAPCIPLTLPHLRIGVNVQVDALGVGALPVLGKEKAFGHALQVVLVQELTGIALLAQPA